MWQCKNQGPGLSLCGQIVSTAIARRSARPTVKRTATKLPLVPIFTVSRRTGLYKFVSSLLALLMTEKAC